MGVWARIALFLGGALCVLAAGSTIKGKTTTTVFVVFIIGGTIEVLVGAFLMLTAALGRLPW